MLAALDLALVFSEVCAPPNLRCLHAPSLVHLGLRILARPMV